MDRDLMLYEIALEMPERDAALTDRQAVELLQAEFALANNAARFDILSGDDIGFYVVSRSTPQEGVARYDVELELRERDPRLDYDGALKLLRRAFQDANNASYFVRVSSDEIAVTLLSRAPVADVASQRLAA